MATMRDISDLDTALLACSDEQLAQIARLWGVQGKNYKNRQELIGVLEGREASDLVAARFVWEALMPNERTVLFRILTPSARTGLSRPDLAKKTRLAVTEVNEAVEPLKRYVLIYEDAGLRTPKEPVVSPFNESADVLYDTGREFFKADRDLSKKKFEEIVAKLDDYTIYAIFQNYDIRWQQGYYPQASLGRLVATTLINVSEPLDFLRQINEQTRRVYLWLREQGGKMTMRDVRIHLELNDAALWEVVHDLERAALAFDTFSGQERVLFIPQDIYSNWSSAASAGKAQAPKSGLVTLDSDLAMVRHAETIVLYDLAVLVNAIHQQNIEPTQSGRVPKRIANKLRPLLQGRSRMDYEGYDDYHEMLLYALGELEVLQLAPPPLPDLKARYEPGPQLASWAEMSAVDQTKRLLRHWLTSSHWIDIAGVEFDPWDLYAVDLRAGRELLLKHLRQCTQGRWYSIEAMLRMIWEENSTALQPSTYMYMTPREKQQKPRKAYEKWLKSDGEIYVGLLASSLYELGIVALGYQKAQVLEGEKPADPDYFMVTELGVSVIATGAAATTPATSGENARLLVVQPNFELMLLQPHFPTLYSILPYVQVSQIGVVSRMTLTRQSILRGLEMGMGKNVEQVIQTLAEHSQKELPQNVVYTLNDWTKQYKEVKITPILLLEVSSEAVAEQVCASTKLKKFGVRQIAPTVVVVDVDSNLQELRSALDKEGITVHFGGSFSDKSQRSNRGRYDR